MKSILPKFSCLKSMGIFFLGFLLMGAELGPGELSLQEAIAYRVEGRRSQENGDLRHAAMSYQKAVSVDPSYADAYNDLGVVLESMGDLANAESAYKSALKTNPRLLVVHSNLALFYERMGRIKEAAEHWTARIQLGSPYDPWVLKAREKLQQYKFPLPEPPVKPSGLEVKGTPAVSKETKGVPPETASSLELARARVIAQEVALEKLKVQKPGAKKPEIAVPPSSGAPPLPQASVPSTSSNEQAFALANKLTREKERTRGKTVGELTQRAVAAMRKGQYEEAKNHYEQALALDSNNLEARQGLKRAETALAKAKRIPLPE